MFGKQFGYSSVLCYILFCSVLFGFCFVRLNSIRSTEILFLVSHKNRIMAEFRNGDSMCIRSTKKKPNERASEQSQLLVVVYNLSCVVCYVKLQRRKRLVNFCSLWNGWWCTVAKLCNTRPRRQRDGLIEEKQWESTANGKVLMRIQFIRLKNGWLVSWMPA